MKRVILIIAALVLLVSCEPASTYERESNNTRETANALVNGYHKGKIGWVGDQDFWVLTISDTHTHTFGLTGLKSRLQLVVYIYDLFNASDSGMTDNDRFDVTEGEITIRFADTNLRRIHLLVEESEATAEHETGPYTIYHVTS